MRMAPVAPVAVAVAVVVVVVVVVGDDAVVAEHERLAALHPVDPAQARCAAQRCSVPRYARANTTPASGVTTRARW